MKRFTTHSPSLLPVLLSAAALLAALVVSSCSRSGVADSLTGPSHGATAFAKGPGREGTPPPPPQPPPPDPGPAPAPPPPGAACTSLTGLGGTVLPVAAGVPQNRPARLRIEVEGDVASGTLNALGTCSSLARPTVTFISGRATVSGSGLSVSETFGPLTPLPDEPGIVIATSSAGNELEIIWPALGGDPAGPPIFRYQLGRSGAAGTRLSVTMQFTARTANGSTATFNVSASNLTIPALKL